MTIILLQGAGVDAYLPGCVAKQPSISSIIQFLQSLNLFCGFHFASNDDDGIKLK